MWGIIEKIELSYSLAKSAAWGEAGRVPRLPSWTLGPLQDRNVRV
ncbi:MAG: hypothetical protein AVDCRST_MAG02-1381 [uncultured Rubrobacteraceae bacterium]|uniref:Uncharacterized protein n=1 Tax=uncultured Rubrobacteraceae bacterium TaxID=349277 RepID=A0A6J4QYH1_9ACTN|nr:MAG: hypothetical protein AVDCRST_MAG02-1381 [uncultured Rubrobacteraceae bacterium]